MTTLKQRFVEFMRGPSGRVARLGLGVVLLAGGLLLGGTAGTALAIFSAMPIASALIGFCPLGPLFGVDFRGCERDCGRRGAPGRRGAW
jgi:hypothetical protein